MKRYLSQHFLLLTLLAGACGPQRQDPASHGFDGLLDTDPPSSRGAEFFVSPMGRLVRNGSVDELGYILPLDIRRPHEPVPRPPAPRPGQEAFPRRGGPVPEYLISPNDGHTQNETSIDVDNGTVVAGWNQFTSSGLVMGWARSEDNGQNWSSGFFDGFARMSDPIVAAAGDGRWYYAFLAGGSIEIYVSRSVDDGMTWATPVAVTNNITFDDKPHLVASGDDLLIAWADFSFSPARVSAAVSHNGGMSFSNHTALAQNAFGGNGACSVFDPSGSYHVFWRGSFQEFIWMASSHDAGLSWTTDRQVVVMSPLPSSFPPGFRTLNFPSVAAGLNPGELIMVWNDQRFGNPDILGVSSEDGGLSWSEPIKVNDDSGDANQFFPWIASDGEGAIHVVWYDGRHGGTDLDVYSARSTDGGASFEANLRITATSFTPVLPHEAAAAPFIGDYNGIAAEGGTVVAAYQDARRGEQDVYAAFIETRPGYAELLILWPGGATVLDLVAALVP